ncbi:MAG: 2Fe-2S ferredoxin [Alphaproteobacteria bacterium]|nr:2Fe-2S ferredoxin [Alphaproteobacteria bacterium]
MPNITFVLASGEEKQIDAPNGISLLEVAHKNHIPLEGACEGSLACSTCHVIIDEAFYAKLPAATDDEEDMLDLAFGLSHTSRLGCQIMMNDSLEGMKVSVPGATRNMMVDKK